MRNVDGKEEAINSILSLRDERSETLIFNLGKEMDFLIQKENTCSM